MTQSSTNQLATAVAEPRHYSQSEMLEHVRTTLVSLFQLPPESVTLDARLLDDLEIDSIDVVDLMEEVRHFTGKKVTVEDFRSVRTVRDLVDVLQRLLA